MCHLISQDKTKENNSQTSTFLYLIIQLLTSMGILVTVIGVLPTPQKTILIMFILIIKIGVWPFHLWYIKILSQLNIKIKTFLLIITWQKILPLGLMSFIPSLYIFIVIGFLSIISPLAKIKQSISIKSLMVLSSLNNNGWLVILCCIRYYYSCPFLTIYSLALSITIHFIKNIKTKNWKTSRTLWQNFTIMSNIRGFPPIIIFSGKIMVLFFFINQSLNISIIALSLIVIAFVFIYSYSSRLLNNILTRPNKIIITRKNINLRLIFITSFFSFILLLIIILGIT